MGVFGLNENSSRSIWFLRIPGFVLGFCLKEIKTVGSS